MQALLDTDFQRLMASGHSVDRHLSNVGGYTAPLTPTLSLLEPVNQAKACAGRGGLNCGGY